MRKAAAALFIALFVLESAASTDAENLARLSDSDLSQLRTKAEARIDVLERYEIARNGTPSESNSEIINRDYQIFLAAVQNWNGASRLEQNASSNCSRYIANFKEITAEIKDAYPSAYKRRMDQAKNSLLARARLEALGYILLSESQLANAKSEGGEAPITGGIECAFESRTQWFLATNKIQDAWKTLSEATWGRPGIRDPFQLSKPLLKILNAQERSKFTWSVVSYSAETVFAVAALSLVSTKILTPIDALLGVRFSKVLKTAAVAGLGAYGGYRGYRYANKKETEAEETDDWHHIQEAAESLMELNPKDIQNFYLISRELEKMTLEYNVAVANALEPDIATATQRFQTLDNAKKITQLKLVEIDTEIGRRKKANR